MTDELKPALSADEWKLPDARRSAFYAMAEADHTLTVGDGKVTSHVGLNIPSGELTALIALANAALPDNSPYKITRAEWYDLESSVSNMEGLAVGLEDRSDLNGPAYARAMRRLAKTLKTLAGKLDALLPPEKPDASA